MFHTDPVLHGVFVCYSCISLMPLYPGPHLGDLLNLGPGEVSGDALRPYAPRVPSGLRLHRLHQLTGSLRRGELHERGPDRRPGGERNRGSTTTAGAAYRFAVGQTTLTSGFSRHQAPSPSGFPFNVKFLASYFATAISLPICWIARKSLVFVHIITLPTSLTCPNNCPVQSSHDFQHGLLTGFAFRVCRKLFTVTSIYRLIDGFRSTGPFHQWIESCLPSDSGVLHKLCFTSRFFWLITARTSRPRAN